MTLTLLIPINDSDPIDPTLLIRQLCHNQLKSAFEA